MGVPGLWDLIRHTGKSEALAQLALEGFRRDKSAAELKGLPNDTPHPRALRIGIDASIWFFHAAYGREGENPELRTLFFRLARLASYTFCPLFVFDGPQRPKTKRGKTINTRMNSLAPGMKNMIAAFGFEWRTAPGEAEAELAYLNNIGVIDAVLSDDVDNFLFGARVVIRNPSGTLSGNRGYPALNSEGKDDGVHVMVYRAADIEKDPACKLTRGGMILIALLSGGDYDQGAKRCGPKTALALAQHGLGDELLDAFKTFSRQRFIDYVPAWKHAVVEALRSGCANLEAGDEADDEELDEESQETVASLPASQRSKSGDGPSSKGKGKKKKPPAKRQPALAAAIEASDFPDLAVLEDYCAPWTSERAFSDTGAGPSLDDDDLPFASQGSAITSSQTSTKSTSKSKKKSAALTVNSVGSGGLTRDVRIGWTGELALGALGRICEQYFEWGVREIIQQRFRTVLWPAVVLRVLRRAVMEQDRTRTSPPARDVTPRPSTPTRSQSKQIVPGTPRRLVNRYFGGDSDSDSDDARSGVGRGASTSRGGDETPRAKRTISLEGEQVDTRQLLQLVRGERQHVSTDRLKELRVEVKPGHLARLAVRQLLGTRDPALLAGTMFDMEAAPAKDGAEDEDEEGEDEEGTARRLKLVDPSAPIRVWVPAELVQMVHPELVRAWEERGTKTKSKAKATGSTTRRKAVAKDGDTATKGASTSRAKAKGKAVLKEKARNLPTTLSGDEIEDEVPVVSASRSMPEPPLRSRSGSIPIRSTSPTAHKAPVSKPKPKPRPPPQPTTSLDTIPERSSSPSLAPERSSSPPAAPPRPKKTISAPACVTTKGPISRIPGVEYVPTPPRRTATTSALGPASDSSELEDISFGTLLSRPKKHSAPDLDSDVDSEGPTKSPRRSRVQTSPRNSFGSRIEINLPPTTRKPSSSKTAIPAPTRRSHASSSSEVEILDSTPARPVKHKSPEAEVAGPRQVRRRSLEQSSPRASSGSEDDHPKSRVGKTAINRLGSEASRPREKSSGLGESSKTALARGSSKTSLAKSVLDESVVEIMTSSDDGGMTLLPKLSTSSKVLATSSKVLVASKVLAASSKVLATSSKVSLRPSGTKDRVVEPPSMTRLDKTAKKLASSRASSSTLEVGETSVIDLISD